MFLKRLKIHNFRVLKNAELHFEPEFTPTIYPLGSLNGGGKSTLLQLVFTLLHCSFNKSKHKYLVSLLDSLAKNSLDEVKLAEFEIIHNSTEFSIEFIIHPNTFSNFSFNCFLDIEDIKDKISQAKALAEVYDSAFSVQERMSNTSRVSPLMQKEVQEIVEKYIRYSDDRDFKKQYKSLLTPNEILGFYEESIRHILTKTEEISQDDLDEMLSATSAETNKLKEALQSEKLLYITHLTDDNVLLCKTTADASFLESMSSKVYLATPSTQILLFLSEDEKKSLFSTERYTFDNYYSNVNNAKENLPGLFTYDFESPNIIANAFKTARDKDFKEALNSDDYGGNLKKLKTELQNFLFGKIITIAPDFSKVIFKLENSKDELSPEDLSHGELKKLSIYIWLSSYDITDSLVLMDEIELGMHPDWQYEIVNDLQEWSKGNQFILATHSYELCQAVTPSHVNELEPRLTKK
ncbi:MAG: AAA family ATPase [Desulfobacterales bacterium]|nr:AAA family ATPase [Desulfobacterales bacterium]